MQGDQAWVTMRQAAIKLGVTPITIRRRLRRGELEGQLTDTPSGQAWLVRIPDGDPPQAEMPRYAVPRSDVPPTDSDPHQSGVQLDSLVALVRDQQQTIMELSGRVGYLQSELRQRTEQLAALQAPAPVPPAQELTAEVVTAEEPPASPQPGRVRRFLRWLVAAE
jgi:hypothetical protein